MTKKQRLALLVLIEFFELLKPKYLNDRPTYEMTEMFGL
jgi:hypothetical protein